jgi:hypothetical protein
VWLVFSKDRHANSPPLHCAQYKFTFHYVQGILFVVTSTLGKYCLKLVPLKFIKRKHQPYILVTNNTFVVILMD